MGIRSGSFRITTGASGRCDSSATSSSISRCSYFVVKDTDVALVVSGGKNQRTLFGLDLGRDLGWAAVHAEAAVPGVGWAPRGNVTVNLDAVLLLGPEESEYRLAPVRGALPARLKVLF